MVIFHSYVKLPEDGYSICTVHVSFIWAQVGLFYVCVFCPCDLKSWTRIKEAWHIRVCLRSEGLNITSNSPSFHRFGTINILEPKTHNSIDSPTWNVVFLVRKVPPTVQVPHLFWEATILSTHLVPLSIWLFNTSPWKITMLLMGKPLFLGPFTMANC